MLQGNESRCLRMLRLHADWAEMRKDQELICCAYLGELYDGVDAVDAGFEDATGSI